MLLPAQHPGGQEAVFTALVLSQTLLKTIMSYEKASMAIFQTCSNDAPVTVSACQHSIQVGL